MTYDWYRIVNVTEFEALDLASQEVTLELEGLGEKTIVVTKGNSVGILYEGVFLQAQFNTKNPYEFDGHAVYIDAVNDLYLGIANES